MSPGSPADLIPQQRRIIEWVGHYVNTNDGRVPTYQQIAKAMGYARRSTAQYHMNALRRLGWVRWDPGKLWTLEFKHQDGSWRQLPCQ